MHHKLSRRQFFGQASCAAIGTTTLFNSIFNLGIANTLAAPSPSSEGSYKAMVCILMAGGNDSFNMLVPRSTAAYNEYTAARSNLALPSGDLLPLNFTDKNNKQFGLHPAMPEIQELFNKGKLSFVANIGTLVEPTSLRQYKNKSVKLPVGLLSHADQIQQWQTSIPQNRSARGWGGRIADIMAAMNENDKISMNISLSGANVFQQGNTAIEYAITNQNNGSVGINAFESPQAYDQIIKQGVESMLNQQYQDIFRKTYRDRITTSQESHLAFDAALKDQSLSTTFSGSNLSQNLKMVARTIAARQTLGMNRQTFFINYGGWDHHDEVLNNQVNMLGVVSKALGEFQTALEELQIADAVTTFTISDFGRTLTSNGNGSDHAWGGNVMVMGAPVNGGKIFGEYPSLALDGTSDVGGAILLPTLSTDEYFAELSSWFGVSNGDMQYVLPNIGNFYDVNSGQQPIGFMK